MEFIQISKDEKAFMSLIEPTYKTLIEQKPEEQEFLFSLACRSKAKKALEVGVSTGASSALLAHVFLRDNSKSQFYSIDYCEDWYANNKHKTGFVMNVYPKLQKKWILGTGGLAANFMDTFGSDFDFVFLDTSHEMPCEILDFLMILPYLSENCMLVLHDANLQTAHPLKPEFLVNNLLISAISGKKFLPRYAKSFYAKNNKGEYFNSEHLILNESARFIDKAELATGSRHIVFSFPNIAAVQLDKSTRENIWSLFNLLAQPWQYVPKESDYEIMKTHFRKHYEPFYCNMFEASYELQKYSMNLREVIKEDSSLLGGINLPF